MSESAAVAADYRRAPRIERAESVCRQCREAFKPRVRWQRFCTVKCRNDWHGDQVREIRARYYAERDRRAEDETEIPSWWMAE